MITEINIKDIPGRACGYNNEVTREVMEFHKSEWAACEVSTGKYKTCHSAYAAYKEAIKKARVNVIVFERSGRLFMVRGE